MYRNDRLKVPILPQVDEFLTDALSIKKDYDPSTLLQESFITNFCNVQKRIPQPLSNYT